MKKLWFVIALFGVILFTSCSKLPQDKINEVTALVDSAKVVGADVYVPELYVALTDSLNSVNVLVEVEKTKWFKSYKEVEAGLAKVGSMAGEVLTKTEARKAELKAENDTLLVEVKALVETNKELVKKAPKGKGGREALAEINVELDAISASVTEVETLVANGDILNANTKIKAAKTNAEAIKTELENAIAKKNR